MAVLCELGRRYFADADRDGYLLNVYTEFLGVMATVLFLDVWYQHRDKIRGKQELKSRLLQDVISPINSTAIDAIHRIDQMGWLNDANGLLTGKTFFDVNWENADLTFANLENTGFANARLAGAKFTGANLNGVTIIEGNFEGANLWSATLDNSKLPRACLSGADLLMASLTNADLRQANFANATCVLANFQNANLGYATLEGVQLDSAKLDNTNLAGVDLEGASLKGASLEGACLHNANLKNVGMDENTTLPDGSMWTNETDMDQFTDPDRSVP